MMLLPLDRDSLREQYANASPFPFVKIENFLDPGFAAQVAGAYPSFAEATGKGRTFKTVNEQKKVQVTDARLFPAPVAQLNAALASPAFISDLSYITSIPDLLADAELNGGGMHVTGPGGRLDVHVDFNYLEHRRLHRRLNLLLYLNSDWKDEWGGHIQLPRCHADHDCGAALSANVVCRLLLHARGSSELGWHPSWYDLQGETFGAFPPVCADARRVGSATNRRRNSRPQAQGQAAG